MQKWEYAYIEELRPDCLRLWPGDLMQANDIAQLLRVDISKISSTDRLVAVVQFTDKRPAFWDLLRLAGALGLLGWEAVNYTETPVGLTKNPIKSSDGERLTEMYFTRNHPSIFFKRPLPLE